MFTLGICPSTSLRVLVLIMHGLAASAVLLAELAGWQQALMVALLTASAVRFVRLGRTQAIRCQADGTLLMEANGDWQGVEVLSDTVVLAWLVALRYRNLADGRTETRIILPDSLAQDEFRRLRVWLKWRARLNVKQVWSGQERITH